MSVYFYLIKQDTTKIVLLSLAQHYERIGVGYILGRNRAISRTQARGL